MAKRQVPPAFRFMQRRGAELRAQGMSFSAAAKKAGAEWQAQKRSGGSASSRPRRNPAFQSLRPAPAPRVQPFSGGRYETGQAVRIKASDEPGQIIEAKRGAEDRVLGIFPRRRKPTYLVRTEHQQIGWSDEGDLERLNPLANPLMLGFLALLAWGIVQRMRPAQPPPEAAQGA